MIAIPATFLRIVLSVLAAVAAVLATATPALAHTELKSSDPADGASLGSAPGTVTLTFEEAVTLPDHPISIVGPDGSAWTVGTPTITGASVSAPVQATAAEGQCTLHYTVTADDGDTVNGLVHFTVGAAAATSADAAPATMAPAAQGSSDSGGSSGWTWVAVLVVLLGLAAAALTVVRTRRRGRRADR